MLASHLTNENTKTEQHTHRVSIVGAGPSGLAKAISLLKEAKDHPDQKYKIDLFEKRDDYVRRQKLVLFYPDRSIVSESTMWDDWAKKTFYPDDDIQVDKDKHLLCNDEPFPLPLTAKQKFLRKILAQEHEAKGANFSLRSLELALKEYIENEKLDNVDLNMHFNTKIDKVVLRDANGNSSVMVGKDHYPFDTLFICEGVKRETVKLVNDGIEAEKANVKPFTFEELGVSEHLSDDKITTKKYYPLHFSSRFIFTDDIDHSKQDSPYSKEAIEELIKLGYDVKVHNDDNLWNRNKPNWKLRVSISGRVPAVIAAIPDDSGRKAKLIQYIQLVLSAYHNLPKEKFVIDPKGDPSLNFSLFTLDLKSVDNPVRKLPSGAYVALIGDCAQTAFHESGFSSELALNGAILSTECLIDNLVAGKYDDEYVDPYELYVRKCIRHREFLENYLDAQFHQEIHDMTNSQKNSFFQHTSHKNTDFLKIHVNKFGDYYNLTTKMANKFKGSTGVDYNARLTKQIENLEEAAYAGNVFATFTLAKQLSEGIKFEIAEEGNNGTKIAITMIYKDLDKSLFFWKSLEANGFTVDKEIKETELQLLNNKSGFAPRS